jgi:hypothetical protein
MPNGSPSALTPLENSVTTPLVVMRATRAGGPFSVNQRFPSGPVVIDSGDALTVNPGATPPVYSVTVGVRAAAGVAVMSTAAPIAASQATSG